MSHFHQRRVDSLRLGEPPRQTPSANRIGAQPRYRVFVFLRAFRLNLKASTALHLMQQRMLRYRSFRDLDWPLLVITLIISALGVLQIYSATLDTKWQDAWWKQV